MTTPKIINVNRSIKGGERTLTIELDNGRIITAQRCHESWEQWGGTPDELRITLPKVEAHNDWLHGGAEPEN